jgi:hypothetical protein
MNDDSSHQMPPAPLPPAVSPVPAPPPVIPPAPAPTLAETKSPALAGLLSMFPGLGHLYLGLYQRAFAFGGAFIVLISLTSHGRGGEFFGPMIAFVWFFAIIDAVRQAKAINRGFVAAGGYAPSRELRRAAEGTASLTWGVILVGIGALWLANRYLDLDRFWDIIDTWGGPAAFILLGLVLIFTHLKRKRAENESGVGMPPRST